MTPALLLSDDSSLLSMSHYSSEPSRPENPTTASTTTCTAKSCRDRRDRRRDRYNGRNPLLKRSARGAGLLITGADGNWLQISDGASTWRIFDGSGGAAVSNIGHGDRRVQEALNELSDTGIGYAASMSFDTDVVLDFGYSLLESTNDEMKQVAFYNSGSDAVEAGKKLAYQYHSKIKQDAQPGRRWFIARDRSYHGSTLGALETGGHKGRKEPYKPIMAENTHFISPCYAYRDLKDGETGAQYVQRLAAELEDKILELGPESVAGFIAEPVVGAALGCAPALPGYLEAMKKVCKEYGVLCIWDEIMCGMGRTGYMHAWQEEGVAPDIQLVGKGLAGGYAPLSAMLVGPQIVDALGDHVFSHGHTFQNMPSACAAGLTVQEIIEDENLVQNVQDKGKKLKKLLMTRLSNHPHVGDIRGKGLFIGIEFVLDKSTKTPFNPDMAVATKIYEQGLKDGYNIYVYPGSGTVDGDCGDHVIIAPAFNITDADVNVIVDSVSKLIFDFFDDLGAGSEA